jgi:TonB family protein
MRPLSCIALAFVMAVSAPLAGQTPSSQEAPPQTARQALIEMLFGKGPGHFEKHLPDITRQSFDKLGGAKGSGLIFLSQLEAQSKTGKENFETFDTGSTLLIAHEPMYGASEKTEVTVERDDLLGDEDQIELALHTTKNGKEEPLLPQVLRFTLTMKMESGVWRLNEVGAAARFPLADPAFLKAIEEIQLSQNEQIAQWSIRSLVNAEKSYQAAEGAFACSLSALGSTVKGTEPSKRTYLYDLQLAEGKKNGYRFTISDCSQAHYWVVGESLASGQPAFCSDESGTLRASSDGKGATCISSGEVVEDKTASLTGALHGGTATAKNSASVTSPAGGRVRVPEGVATGLIVNKVQPTYPPEARQARIQGSVVLKAEINQAGDVVSLELVSGHPMLAPAAIEAVKQWKYKPCIERALTCLRCMQGIQILRFAQDHK